jgi:hypothetical protein
MLQKVVKTKYSINRDEFWSLFQMEKGFFRCLSSNPAIGCLIYFEKRMFGMIKKGS